jgi:hypothetical protein
MTRKWTRLAAATGVAMWVAAGCAGTGGDSDDSAPASTGHEVADEADVDAHDGEAGAAEAEAEAADAAGGDAPAASAALDLTAPARDVVRTGSLRVTVDEVDEMVPRVQAIATTAGGFVADEQVRSDDDEADITIRVPADDFDDVRGEVAALGEVTAQDTQAEDVTAQTVDLEGRIASQRASVERVRALLAESGDVVQLATVEGELARREAELESLLGQQRVLEDQVAMSTLTVHGREEATADDADGSPAGFTDGLRTGWDAAVAGARAASTAAGFLLPFALPAAVVLVGVRRWLRRDRDRSGAPAGSEV